MRFRIGLLIAVSLLFFFDLPRQMVYFVLSPLYAPLTKLELLIKDVERMREEMDFAFQMSPFERRVFVNSPVYDNPYAPRYIVLPFGTLDGVSYGDPLVVISCVAGKVIRASSRNSVAITINNPSFSVPVYDNRSGLLSRVVGGNPPYMEHLLGQDIREGDTLYTSGLEGLFPEGLIVGMVGDTLFEEGGIVRREVIPACDLSKLNRFHIIRRGWD